MFDIRRRRTLGAFALFSALSSFSARAENVKTVFVIAMENHNWTQPNTQTNPQQIFQNPAAPFINSLVKGTSGISDQVAFANGYVNAGQGVHRLQHAQGGALGLGGGLASALLFYSAARGSPLLSTVLTRSRSADSRT